MRRDEGEDEGVRGEDEDEWMRGEGMRVRG